MKKVEFTNKVSETLLIPLYMKALESDFKEPILKDDLSLKLYKQIDYDFSKFKKARFSQVGIAIRAAYFDEVAKDFIKNNTNPVVVQIGAGLDTRYWRINGQDLAAHFYELDLPDVITLREELLPSEANNTNLSYSMFDYHWISLLKKSHQKANFLFIAEGVFMFFNEKEIREFVIKLGENFSGELAFDIVSVWLSKNSSKHDTMQQVGANFVFGFDDEKELEKWSSSLKHLETKFYVKQHRSRWGLLANILSLIPRFLNASKMLRYKITKTSMVHKP